MQYQIWKPVQGYNGFYEVSTHGVVRSLNRAIPLPGGRWRQVKGKIISPKRNHDGYIFVSLSRDGVTKTHYVHRLVCGAYNLNPGNLPEVNHRDGCKEHNTPDNLEWCSHRDNVIHAYANGLSRNMGGSHYFAAGVIDKTLGRTFETIREWAAARGIPYSTARNLLNGTNKSRTIDLTGVARITKTNIND